MNCFDTLSDGRLSVIASKNKITLYNIINNTSEDFILEETAEAATTKVGCIICFIEVHFGKRGYLKGLATRINSSHHHSHSF